jgi:Lytic transglycolase
VRARKDPRWIVVMAIATGVFLLLPQPDYGHAPAIYSPVPQSLIIPITERQLPTEGDRPTRAPVGVPAASPSPKLTPRPTPRRTPAPTHSAAMVQVGGWIHDPDVSWYGPSFYGGHTACGQAYTTTIVGVAHRTLPCGTLVEFRWNGRVIRAPVIDRGPYVAGRQWDLSGALCKLLDHCWTGPLDYRIP